MTQLKSSGPALILVSVHSAGGYLAFMVGLAKRWFNKYDVDANCIAGFIPFSGQAITHFTIPKERDIAETQPTIGEFAPTYHVRANAPPLNSSQAIGNWNCWAVVRRMRIRNA